MKKTIIIGNADILQDHSKFIESCDNVVRFNLCRNYGGNTGDKTDTLCLVNTGRPGKNFAREKQIENKNYSNQASKILFSRPKLTLAQNISLRLTNRKSDIEHSPKIISRNGLEDKKIEYVDPDMYQSLWNKLLTFGATEAKQPSSGICAIEHIINDENLAGHAKYIIGFTWEGSPKHPWILEKALIQDYFTSKKLIPL